jgi:outer membrane protein TolC
MTPLAEPFVRVRRARRLDPAGAIGHRLTIGIPRMARAARTLVPAVLVAASSLGAASRAAAQFTDPVTSPLSLPTLPARTDVPLPGSAPAFQTDRAPGVASPPTVSASSGGDASVTPPSAGDAAASAELLAVLRGSDGGLTADEVARRAVETSPGLERARQATLAAEAGAARALYAFIPRLDLSARYTRLSPVTFPPISFGQSLTPAQIRAAQALIDGVMDTNARLLFQAQLDAQVAASQASFRFPVILDQYAFKGTLTVPVSDLFLTIAPAYRASRRFADAAAAQAESQRQSVALQARETYYGYARARAGFAVAALGLRQVQAHREDVAAFVAAQTAPAVELQRMEAQLAAMRVALARAAGGVAIAQVALRQLMHDRAEGDLPLGEDLSTEPPLIPGTLERLVARALDARPELTALRHVIEGRQEVVAARRAQILPRVAIAANAEVANPNQRIFPQESVFRGTWDVSAVLSWSPNDALTASRDGDAAAAELAQARADLLALEDGLRVEVAQAFEQYRAAREALEAARTGEAAAAESARIRAERFRAGASVTSDLVDAEAELSRARLDLINAAIDLRIAHARLRRAIGEDLTR